MSRSLIRSLSHEGLTVIDSCDVPALEDLKSAIAQSLNHPTDFPSVDLALLPGDTATVCVSGRTPRLPEVIEGVLDALAPCRPSAVDVVIDELGDAAMLAAIQAAAGERADVHLHVADDRSELAYLAADAEARPVYLNRRIVDADWVLPIAIHRGGCDEMTESLIYPALADSATHNRRIDQGTDTALESSPAWLVGVQLMMALDINDSGAVCGVRCGMRRQSPDPSDASSTETSDASKASATFPAVVVSFDGLDEWDWPSAIDAVGHATALLEEDGVIVVELPPQGSPPVPTTWQADQDLDSEASTGELPAWDPMRARMKTLVQVTQNYRVFVLDSRDGPQPVDASEDASTGDRRSIRDSLAHHWGIETIDDGVGLERLLGEFDRVGWWRAAGVPPTGTPNPSASADRC